MDTTVIHTAAAATLAGTMPFPQVVEALLATGVEYYHVDYVSACKRFYDAAGACVVTPVVYPDLPPVAAELDVEALRANIHDSQQRDQPYHAFTTRAMNAGVIGYIAFLRGHRVTYFGRRGDQHTEWFPGAGPKS